MHELVNNKNEKREKSRSNSLSTENNKARSIRQKPRTGPPPTSSTSLSIEEKQQKRIAARAANAMAQVLQRSSGRRREPRSLLMWGDRKKAVIKSYPDGGQEIIVPQTLTIEQEHYEFPPRSRFLKKLATSTAERKRLSIVDEPTLPTITPILLDSHINHSNTMLQKPDQLSLKEWFSKKDSTTKVSKTNRAVIDWMNDVERSSKNLLSVQKVKPSPTCSTTTKIQFKSDAGKRWANSITSNTSLLPPDDHCRKHYVPRRLLTMSIIKQKDPVTIDDTASKIQSMWKEYQSTKTNRNNTISIENQIGLTAMESTGQRTPIAGMVHILEMLQTTAKLREQSLHDRIEQVKQSLKQETLKRQSIQDDLNTTKESEKSLLSKVNQLEDLISKKKRETSNNKLLQKTSIIQNANLRKKSSVVPVPPPTSKSLLKSSKPPLPPISRKPSSAINTTTTTRKVNNTRSLARTSSLANAGVISSPRNSSSIKKQQ